MRTYLLIGCLAILGNLHYHKVWCSSGSDLYIDGEDDGSGDPDPSLGRDVFPESPYFGYPLDAEIDDEDAPDLGSGFPLDRAHHVTAPPTPVPTTSTTSTTTTTTTTPQSSTSTTTPIESHRGSKHDPYGQPDRSQDPFYDDLYDNEEYDEDSYDDDDYYDKGSAALPDYRTDDEDGDNNFNFAPPIPEVLKPSKPVKEVFKEVVEVEIDSSVVHPDLPMTTSTPATPLIDAHDMENNIRILTQTNDERQVSIFAQPGLLAAFIGGAVMGLLCAILLVMFIVYRMRKRDEGSYPLDEPKRVPLTSSYAPNDKEIYA